MTGGFETVVDAMADAEQKAWDALAGYKFWMFGYHAGRWVNYNQLLPRSQRFANPFRDAVRLAREKADAAQNGLPKLPSARLPLIDGAEGGP